MRFVIRFKIISDGVSGLIPMTDIYSDLHRANLLRYDGLSIGWYFGYQNRCFLWKRFLVEPAAAKQFLISK